MKILITAGPTREPIDAVRYISNRSSGKMGLALTQAAMDAGHDTTLLAGPGVLVPDGWQRPQPRLRVYRFGSSAELKQLLDAHWPGQDWLIMAAAVADYRPACVAEGKLPRRANEPLILTLEPVPDLVQLMAATKKPGQRVIAFALEQKGDLEARAKEKLHRKAVDAIIANPLGTMESDRIAPVWLSASGQRDEPGLMTKDRFARWVLDQMAAG